MIIYNKAGAVSAKALATALGLKAVNERKWKPAYPSPKIRWGTSATLVNDDCEINKRRSISIAADGIASLQVLAAAGITVPTLHQVYNVNDLPEGTLLARKKYHRAGQDIIYCPTKEDAVDAFNDGRRLFSEFVPTYRELRVHVVDGKVVKAFRKDNPNATETDFIRSSKFGWGYKKVDIERFYPTAVEVALEVAAALDLHFVGVDMASTNDTHTEWIVWEPNTAPALNTDTLAIYAELLAPKI